jgi:hypothetical protein
MTKPLFKTLTAAAALMVAADLAHAVDRQVINGILINDQICAQYPRTVGCPGGLSPAEYCTNVVGNRVDCPYKPPAPIPGAPVVGPPNYNAPDAEWRKNIDSRDPAAAAEPYPPWMGNDGHVHYMPRGHNCDGGDPRCRASSAAEHWAYDNDPITKRQDAARAAAEAAQQTWAKTCDPSDPHCPLSKEYEKPIAPIVGDGSLLFTTLIAVEKGQNIRRCAANMPTCMNDAQWSAVVEKLDARTDHALKALGPKQKNCLFKVVTNPSLGKAQDCGTIVAGDDADWYYSVLLEVVGPN